eukprot:gene19855-22568_t
MNEAFASGRIEFAAYGDLPSVILNAGGVRTQVIVPAGRGADLFLLVPTNSSARSLVDLKGKRISVHRGRPWELGLLHLIEDNRLTPRDFKLVNMDIKPGASALATGAVDGLFQLNGYPQEDKGIGKIIWTSKGQPDRKMRAELWGRRDFTRANPELAELVATAWVKAQHWAALKGTSQDEAKQQSWPSSRSLCFGSPERKRPLQRDRRAVHADDVARGAGLLQRPRKRAADQADTEDNNFVYNLIHGPTPALFAAPRSGWRFPAAGRWKCAATPATSGKNSKQGSRHYPMAASGAAVEQFFKLCGLRKIMTKHSISFIAAALLSTSVFAAEVPAVFDAKNCKAEYPKASLLNEEQGAVSMAFLVSTGGEVVDSKVEKSSGYKNLDKAAVKAISACKFKPGTKDGAVAQTWTKVDYVWKL